jgi:superfamily II DNA or RNA helicase
MNKDIEKRYDEFQSKAVRNIVRDFTEKPSGRFLLVIPTGGGKTFTAVKSVCELFEKNTLTKDLHKVLWVAHREELIEQARSSFQTWINNNLLDLSIDEDLIVEGISAGTRFLANNPSVKLIVIDEAHHSAAPSYKPFFASNEWGVLGLTATPSRHDGNPLEFERESYSIGFPDLVRRGIILRPTIHRIDGIETDVQDLRNDQELNKLNTSERNLRIINALIERREIYRKVVVYVGTKEHARNLYEQLNSSVLERYYDSISYIVGDENSRKIDRKSFFEIEREISRSIIVNVQVLTEGYDDPSINAVVMAAPSRSKLYYMQALGRALRHDQKNALKAAYVLEIDDKLPNIRYRIDNRWLYSDISDALEPAVIDAPYDDEKSLSEALDSLYLRYNVPAAERKYPVFSETDRYSLLLFRQYLQKGVYRHRAIVITNDNRTAITGAFNFLSERATDYVSRKYSALSVFETLRNVIRAEPFPNIDDRVIFDAVSNAAMLVMEGRENPDFVTEGAPWMTICSFQFHVRDNELPPDLLGFIHDMTNSADVLGRIVNRDFDKSDVLVKMPLPLGKSHGLFVTYQTAAELQNIIGELVQIKQAIDSDQLSQLLAFREGIVLPVEIRYFQSLTLIVRDSLPYQYPLESI